MPGVGVTSKQGDLRDLTGNRVGIERAFPGQHERWISSPQRTATSRRFAWSRCSPAPARIAAHQLIAFAMDLHLASAAPGVRRRTGSAAPDRDDPEPVAGGVLDQDRHELAGRVTGVPGVGLLHDALHVTAEASMLNCAESRCTTWAIATRSAPEAGINYQLTGRHDPVNPASGDHPIPQDHPDQHTHSDHFPAGGDAGANPDIAAHPVERPPSHAATTANQHHSDAAPGGRARHNLPDPASPWVNRVGHQIRRPMPGARKGSPGRARTRASAASAPVPATRHPRRRPPDQDHGPAPAVPAGTARPPDRSGCWRRMRYRS